MEKTIFTVILRYLVPKDVIDTHRPAHLEFLDKYYELGVFLISGRQVPAFGGVIMAQAESRVQLKEILAEDPYQKEGLAEYQIFEFAPTKYSVKNFEHLFANLK